MFTGGIAQGVLNSQQQAQQASQQQQDMAYKQQLMAMQAIALENARSQQAKTQQLDEMAGYEDPMTAPAPPPGQSSVPMMQPGQQPPQMPQQAPPQGQMAPSAPPQMNPMSGPVNQMPMQPPMQQAQQRPMMPPQGAPVPQPQTQQQILPYKTVSGMSQQPAQTGMQQQGMTMAPPPVGATPAMQPQGGAPQPPGMPDSGSPFSDANVTPEQASQIAAAQIMKLATGPDAYTVMKQNVMKHLIANGVPPQQADQQAARYLANSPVAQTKLKALEAQRAEALKITEEAQKAADTAYKSVLLKQSQAQTKLNEDETRAEAKVRDAQAAKYQNSELGIRREELNMKKAAAAGAGTGSKTMAESDAAMVLEGAPRTAVVGGMGKDSTARWQAAKEAAVNSLMKDKGMTPAQAGQYIARQELEYKARGGALNAMEKRSAGIEYSTEQIKNNIDTMNTVLDKVAAKGGAQILNKPLNKVREALSDEDRGVLDLVTQQVGAEYQRQITGGQLSIAQLHAGAAEDARKLLNQDMTPAEIRAKLPIMMREMAGSTRAAQTVKDTLMGTKADRSSTDSGGIPAGWTVKVVK